MKKGLSVHLKEIDTREKFGKKSDQNFEKVKQKTNDLFSQEAFETKEKFQKYLMDEYQKHTNTIIDYHNNLIVDYKRFQKLPRCQKYESLYQILYQKYGKLIKDSKNKKTNSDVFFTDIQYKINVEYTFLFRNSGGKRQAKLKREGLKNRAPYNNKFKTIGRLQEKLVCIFF